MVKSRYIFLSHPINEQTPSYGNRNSLSFKEISQIKNGDSSNTSEWIFSTNHIGSHIDMPKHFFDNGKTLTDYRADAWFFNKIQLIEIPRNKATLIGPHDIMPSLHPNIDLLLIRTGYEKYRYQKKYWNDNPGFEPEVATCLRKTNRKLRAVGFDFLSLTAWQNRDVGKIAHKNFLKKTNDQQPIWILEDLSLTNISSDIIKVIIAPLFVFGANGSPVTVFAKIRF
jgi:kynurenine formamidase